MEMISDMVPNLIEKIEGPLPKRKERGRDIYRLELTLKERNAIADILHSFSRLAND